MLNKIFLAMNKKIKIVVVISFIIFFLAALAIRQNAPFKKERNDFEMEEMHRAKNLSNGEQKNTWFPGKDFQLKPSYGKFLKSIDFNIYSDHEKSFMVERLPVFLERAERVSKICEEKSTEMKFTNYRVFLIWDTKHSPSTVYCPMFKIASTTWVANYLLMTQDSEKQLLRRRFNTDIHQIAFELYKAPESLEEKSKVLLSGVRFMVVRHPFMRFLSSFKVKLEMEHKNLNESHYVSLRSNVINAERPLGDTNTSKFPTFTEFVKYFLKFKGLVNQKTPLFRPQWRTCKVCQMDYNVIMKLETFVEDQQFIAFLADYKEVKTENQVKHHFSIQHKKTSSKIADEYFSQLTKSQIKELYNIYRMDFEFFEYNIEEFLALGRPEAE